MGVKKYRSVEEMTGPTPRRPLDPDNLHIAFGLMELALRLSHHEPVPGVKKYRSFVDMQGDRTG